MKVRTSVSDYMRMFSSEYYQFLREIEFERQNLETEFAEIKNTHAIRRALFTVPEKLSQMIGNKLDVEELTEFKNKDSALWFAKEFPQFSLTKI